MYYETFCDCFTGNVTFAEFTQFIVDSWSSGRGLNRHWRPQHLICDPCFIKYDFIGHFETIGEDAKRVLAKITASRLNVSFPFKNPSHKKTPWSQVRHEFYDNLSRDVARKLISVYKVDYELFGYDYRWACSDC